MEGIILSKGDQRAVFPLEDPLFTSSLHIWYDTRGIRGGKPFLQMAHGFLIHLNVIASDYTEIFQKIVQFLVFGVHWVHQDQSQGLGLFLIMQHTPAKLI